MADAQIILEWCEKLTGQPRPLPRDVPHHAVALITGSEGGLGYSQLNELLLCLGYDRVSHAFFQFLVDGRDEYQSGSAIRSTQGLIDGVNRFRRLGIFLYGNVKYAFKALSLDSDQIRAALRYLSPRTEQSYRDRHKPIQPIEEIPRDRTYYLGYVVRKQLEERLRTNPNDGAAKREEELRQSIVMQGRRNHDAYLVSDHLDVYIATSMRERHEYESVNDLTRQIFSHPELATLQLRYFDPTQAFCEDRVDKGLAEALMLKRAKCTIYFAQESDTLGKDSELASTLAQGKPVIAYVPQPDAKYAAHLIDSLLRSDPASSFSLILFAQLRLFQPDSAWTDPEVRSWISDPALIDREKAVARLQAAIVAHYDRRASLLKDVHPLGIQVNLTTGVANGVLVARSVESCAKLVRSVVMNQLNLAVEDVELNGLKYTYLRETISGCIFRVVTGDALLTNAFWNFYLVDPAE